MSCAARPSSLRRPTPPASAPTSRAASGSAERSGLSATPVSDLTAREQDFLAGQDPAYGRLLELATENTGCLCRHPPSFPRTCPRKTGFKCKLWFIGAARWCRRSLSAHDDRAGHVPFKAEIAGSNPAEVRLPCDSPPLDEKRCVTDIESCWGHQNSPVVRASRRGGRGFRVLHAGRVVAPGRRWDRARARAGLPEFRERQRRQRTAPAVPRHRRAADPGSGDRGLDPLNSRPATCEGVMNRSTGGSTCG
jgi:hypothetical protein